MANSTAFVYVALAATEEQCVEALRKLCHDGDVYELVTCIQVPRIRAIIKKNAITLIHTSLSNFKSRIAALFLMYDIVTLQDIARDVTAVALLLRVAMSYINVTREEAYMMFDRVLDSGVNHTAEYRDQGSIICQVARRGLVEFTTKCIKTGADVNMEVGGITPLGSAALGGYSNRDVMCLLLRAGARACHHSVTKHDLLNIAIGHEDAQFLSALLATSTPRDFQTHKRDVGSLLHIACRHHSVEVVRVLIDAGVDVNALDILGYTPLVLAYNGREPKEMLSALMVAGSEPITTTIMRFNVNDGYALTMCSSQVMLHCGQRFIAIPRIVNNPLPPPSHVVATYIRGLLERPPSSQKFGSLTEFNAFYGTDSESMSSAQTETDTIAQIN